MEKDFITVTPGTPLSQVVETMTANNTSVLVVALDERVLGLITEREVRFLPSSDRQQASAQSVMKSRDAATVVDLNTSALDVLNIFESSRVSELVVLDEGQLVGLIEKQNFFQRIKSLGSNENGTNSFNRFISRAHRVVLPMLPKSAKPPWALRSFFSILRREKFYYRRY